MAGLWLVGEAVNHVGLYGSNMAEGCSVFQRGSCFPIVIKCHRKCFVKLMYVLMITMTLMMNALYLLRMKMNKIEKRLTHAVNTSINIIWWLDIWQYSMWCSNFSFNLLICAACQLQPWVSLLTFPIILSMYLQINGTLLSCPMNKERLKIY